MTDLAAAVERLEKYATSLESGPVEMGGLRTEREERADAIRTLLAAVSKLPSREEVAGRMRKTWHDFRYPPEAKVPPGADDNDVFDAMADALLALFSKGGEARKPATSAEPPPELWLWLADNGNIRKWDAKAFAEGQRYVAAPVPAVHSGGEVEGALVAEALEMAESLSHAPPSSVQHEVADMIRKLAALQPTGAGSRGSETGGAWRPIDSAPKDRVILLYGRLRQATDLHPKGSIRVVGYWDEIDGAWALTDTTWAGPFFAPTHWAEAIPPPAGSQHLSADGEGGHEVPPTEPNAPPPPETGGAS